MERYFKEQESSILKFGLSKSGIIASLLTPALYMTISNNLMVNKIFGVAGESQSGILWWIWLNTKIPFYELFTPQSFTNYPDQEINISYMYITSLFQRSLGLLLGKVTNELFAYNGLVVLGLIFSYFSVYLCSRYILVSDKLSIVLALMFTTSNIVFANMLTHINYLYLPLIIFPYLRLIDLIKNPDFKKIIFYSAFLGSFAYLDGYGILFVSLALLSITIVRFPKKVNEVSNFIGIYLTIFLVLLPQAYIYFISQGTRDLPIRKMEEGELYGLSIINSFNRKNIFNSNNYDFEAQGLFVGYSLAFIVTVTFILLIYNMRSVLKAEQTISIFILLIILFIFSLGPKISFFNFEIQNYLFNIFPFFEHLRVYNRIQIVIISLIFLLFGYLVKLTFNSSPRMLMLIVAFITASGVALDLTSRSWDILTVNYKKIPGAYVWLSKKQGDIVVADLINKNPDNYFLGYQVIHGKKLINSVYGENLVLSNSLGINDENTGCILSSAGVDYAIWHGNVQELSSLSSINGVKLIKKFEANNVHKSNYLPQTLTDDGSSAVYEIVDSGRRYKGLLKFLSGFEDIESKTNAGIWTNWDKAVFNIVDPRTDSVTNNMSIDFSMTLSSISLNSVTIKQKDEVLWKGKVDQSPVNIAFKAQFNIPIEIYQSNLFVPNQINSESKDYRSLGVFISDYTDALC